MGGHLGFAETGYFGCGNQSIVRKAIIVSAEYGQCIYSGPLRIAEITNFFLRK